MVTMIIDCAAYDNNNYSNDNVNNYNHNVDGDNDINKI